MPAPRKWTDDDLRRAHDGAQSGTQIVRRLGLQQTGPTAQNVRRHAERLGLEWPNGHRRPRHKITIARSYAATCADCGELGAGLPYAAALGMADQHRRNHRRGGGGR